MEWARLSGPVYMVGFWARGLHGCLHGFIMMPGSTAEKPSFLVQSCVTRTTCYVCYGRARDLDCRSAAHLSPVKAYVPELIRLIFPDLQTVMS